MFAVRDDDMVRTDVQPMMAPAEPESLFVLPRPLRRSVRFLQSLAAGRIHIPAHTGTFSAIAFFAAIGLYGMSLGGHTETVEQAATSAVGFGIENVKVSGNSETSEIDILQQLGLDGTTSLVALDVTAIRKLVADLPWVEDVEVRKVYPDTIEVNLKERKAFAIWQHGSELALIEENGSVIAPLRDNKFTKLPLFVGRDAETSAAGFLAEIKQWPDLMARVKAYVRVSGRRWDLRLDDGIVVKLPEQGLERAMGVLETLESEHQLLERDIAAIDLRLDDRTTIQLTAGAAERRQKAVAARAKEIKKEEKDT